MKSRQKYNSTVLMHLAIVLIVLFYYALMAAFDITCVIKAVITIQCPMCGSTRAMMAMMDGDLKAYLSYNAFALFYLVAMLLVAHIKLLNNKNYKIGVYIFVIAVVACGFVYWVLRLTVFA